MWRSPVGRAAFMACALNLLNSAAAFAQPQDTRTPEAVALQTGLERACLPALKHKGAKVSELPGLAHDDAGPFLPINETERLRISPPSAVNPTVCMMTLYYPPGGRKAMLALLDAWSAANHLAPVRVDQPNQGPEHLRWTSTWEGATGAGEMALAFSAEKALDGGPVHDGRNQATLLVSLTPNAGGAS